MSPANVDWPNPANVTKLPIYRRFARLAASTFTTSPTYLCQIGRPLIRGGQSRLGMDGNKPRAPASQTDPARDAIDLIRIIAAHPGWMIRHDQNVALRRIAIRIICDPIRSAAAAFTRTTRKPKESP